MNPLLDRVPYYLEGTHQDGTRIAEWWVETSSSHAGQWWFHPWRWLAIGPPAPRA